MPTDLAGAGTITAADPSISAAAAGALLTLAQWDGTGLDEDLLALIDPVVNGEYVYQDSDRGGTNAPVDGEIGLGPNNSLISAIRVRSSGGVIRFHDDDDPVEFVFSTYFAGVGSDLTLYIQTWAGVASASAGTQGAGYSNWNFAAAADRAIVNGILTSERFILAFARATPVQGAGTITSANPTLAADAILVHDPLAGAGAVTAANPFIAAAGTLGTAPTALAGTGTVTAANPSVAAAATLAAAPQPVAGAGTVTADNPAVSADADLAGAITPLATQGTVSAANPSVTGDANLGPLPASQVGAGTVTADNPSLAAAATTVAVGAPLAGAGAITSADPELVADATVSGEPTPLTASGTVTSAAPSVAGAASAALLTLADWDSTGLQTDLLALIDPNGSGEWVYRAPDRSGTDAPVDGEMGLGPDNVLITGIRVFNDQGQVRFHDNDKPVEFHFEDYFTGTGGGTDLTLYFQTWAHVASVSSVANNAGGANRQGGGFSNWFLTDTGDQDLLDSLRNDSERFILAFARSSAAITAYGTVTADNPSLAADATLGSAPQPVAGAGEVSAANPIIRAEADLAGATTPLATRGVVTADNPSLTAAAALGTAAGSLAGTGEITADDPSLTAVATLAAAPTPATASGTVAAQNPSLTADAQLAGALTALAGAGEVTADDPSLTADAVFDVQVAAGTVTADNPSLTANAVFDVRVAAGTVTASDPSITAAATIVAVGAALAGAGAITADDPSLTAVATLAAAPTPAPASGTVAAQNPSLTADAQLAGALTALAGAGEVTADDPAISAAAALGTSAGVVAAGGTVTARDPFLRAAATAVAVGADLAGAGTVTADNPAIAADASLGGVPAAGTITADDPSITGAATLATVAAALSAAGTVTSANPLVFALDRTPLAVEIVREDVEIVGGQTVIHLQALTSPAVSQTLTYQWSASSGTFDDPTLRTVRWTARRNPLASQDVTFVVHVSSPYFTAQASQEETVLPSGTIAGRIDTDAIAALLVTQWDDATRLQALAAELLAIVDEELTTPLIELEQTTRIATAEGEWLDRIGVRLGVDRPFTADTTFARFGFDGSDGVGYDQGPFDSVISALVNTVPVGDEYFRCLLMIHGHALLGSGSVPDLEAMLEDEFSNVRVEDNADGTVAVRNVANDARQELATIVEAVIRQAMPAGVAVTIEDP